MSPYLFAQAVSVPLGLPNRAIDAAERVLVDCLELEDAAQEQDISPSTLRLAITSILRQCYRIIALQLPSAVEIEGAAATVPSLIHACAD